MPRETEDRIFLSKEELERLKFSEVEWKRILAAGLRPSLTDKEETLLAFLEQFHSESDSAVSKFRIDKSEKRVIYHFLKQYTSEMNSLSKTIYNINDLQLTEKILDSLIAIISTTSVLSSLVRRNLLEVNRDRRNAKKSQSFREDKASARRAWIRRYAKAATIREPQAASPRIVTLMMQNSNFKREVSSKASPYRASRNTLINDVQEILKIISVGAD